MLFRPMREVRRAGVMQMQGQWTCHWSSFAPAFISRSLALTASCLFFKSSCSSQCFFQKKVDKIEQPRVRTPQKYCIGAAVYKTEQRERNQTRSRSVTMDII